MLLLATRSPLTRWGSLASLFVKEHATEPSPRLALGSYIVGDFLGVFLGFINVINVLNIGKASAIVFFALGQKWAFLGLPCLAVPFSRFSWVFYRLGVFRGSRGLFCSWVASGRQGIKKRGFLLPLF